jgi:hypothetical protein
MSTSTICDGCGTPGKTAERGLIKKLDYCEACAAKVDLFLAARDALHTDTVKMWEQGMNKIRKEFTDFRLPDE